MDRLGRYKGLSKNFADAIAWLESKVWKDLPDGKFPIDGTRIHAMIMTYDSKPLSECAYETHRRYADIQILLEGTEAILYRDAAGLAVSKPYVADRDIEFLGDGPAVSDQRVSLVPGMATFFFPEDAHKPCVAQGTPTKVRKLVVKVEVV
jgi:YhcH/YjgK/YiaL family protein